MLLPSSLSRPLHGWEILPHPIWAGPIIEHWSKSTISSLVGAMGISANSYRYTEKLLALEATANCVLEQKVEGFLPLAEWEPFLRSHPDQRLAAFLRRGFRFGFRIGFDRSQPLREGIAKNHQSVALNPGTVSAYIAEEAARHKLTSPPEKVSVHTSPLGIIPKASQPGKYRLIHDLSFPRGFSVNDGINPERCSLRYARVDDAVALARRFGPGALLAKLDLQSAYRMVPVHQGDHHLLGASWQDHIFVDQALPFGLRSAPIIFTAVADGLAWAMSCSGARTDATYRRIRLFNFLCRLG